jgi:hypothetical protein
MADPTAGTWSVTKSSLTVTSNYDAQPVATTTSNRRLGERQANGRLIAAAPELLAACQAFQRAVENCSCVERCECFDQAGDAIRAAISKATGGAQ